MTWITWARVTSSRRPMSALFVALSNSRRVCHSMVLQGSSTTRGGFGTLVGLELLCGIAYYYIRFIGRRFYWSQLRPLLPWVVL